VISRSSSIGRKLSWLSIFASATALFAASVVLLIFQLQEVRSGLLRRLGSVADLIAYSSAAAVDFNDAEAARMMLTSFKTRPEVKFVGIVVNGRIFALYARDRRVAVPDEFLHIRNGHRLTDRDVTVFRPVLAEGRPLGTLFIQSSLRDVDRTFWRFAVVTGIVAIPALLVAVLISQWPQRLIARPILNLAALAAVVSDRKDYSVRAVTSHSAAEIEQLVDTFNHMLAEIQRQHVEIQDASATLEAKVADRTHELALRTEQLEVQERELAAAYRELESFSYSVSHDLRAPLRAIDGFSKALLSGYTDRALDQQGRHFLERVRAGTLKMSALIDDMLHLARVTRSTLQRVDADVSAIAEEVASELIRRNPERLVYWVIEPDLRAFADTHLLTIVFENLLGNAWKFTGHRQAAHIEVGQMLNGDGEPVFFVRDDGAGFDMTYADKLFGAFQRLHHESEFEGTGIGLATVKRIIVRHGGLVWAESKSGEGATFYFTLGGRS
jgi:signal transduction histidine kinase